VLYIFKPNDYSVCITMHISITGHTAATTIINRIQVIPEGEDSRPWCTSVWQTSIWPSAVVFTKTYPAVCTNDQLCIIYSIEWESKTNVKWTFRHVIVGKINLSANAFNINPFEIKICISKSVSPGMTKIIIRFRKCLIWQWIRKDWSLFSRIGYLD